MSRSIVIIILFFGYDRRMTSLAQDEPVEMSLCTKNRTLSVKLDGDLCQCEPNTEASRPPNVRDDYNYVPGVGAYKLHASAKIWNEARKACNREKAHLAVIDSYAEETILRKMLRDAQAEIKYALTTEEALVGVHDLFKEGEWITIKGVSIYDSGYVNWSSTWGTGKQPDNFKGNQNCGAITNTGAMDDVDCQARFAFFCEIPLKCDNKAM